MLPTAPQQGWAEHAQAAVDENGQPTADFFFFFHDVTKILEKKNSNSTQLIAKHEVNLYRLLQIGIIKDWLVINPFTSVYEVNYELITEEEIANNVFKQICR